MLNRVRRHEARKNRSLYEEVMVKGSRKGILGKFPYWAILFLGFPFLETSLSLSLGSILFLSPRQQPHLHLSRSIPCPSDYLRPPHRSQNLPCLFPFQTRPRLRGIATGHRRNHHRRTRRRLRNPSFWVFYFRPNWSEIFEGF